MVSAGGTGSGMSCDSPAVSSESKSDEASEKKPSREADSRSRSRLRLKETAMRKGRARDKAKFRSVSRVKARNTDDRRNSDRGKDKVKENVRDSDREREEDRGKDYGIKKEGARHREKAKDKEKGRERQRDSERGWDRERRSDKGRDRGRDTEKERDREKYKDRNRNRTHEKGKEREQDTWRDRGKERGRERTSRSVSSRRSPSVHKRPTRGFDQREPQGSTPVVVPQSSSMMSMPSLPMSSSMCADPEVEAFLTLNPVDQGTAARFRVLPPNLQRLVLLRGSLVGTRDPSAVLMSRVRDAIQGGGNLGVGMGLGPPVQNPEVEAFLAANPVDFQAASRLRALPSHLQRLVMMRGSMSGVRDASSVLMSRVRDAMASSMGGAMMMGAGQQPTQPPPNFRPGDWMCPKCNFHNYSSKILCTQCTTPAIPAGGHMMSGAYPGLVVR